MAQTRYEVNFYIPTRIDGQGQPAAWSSQMRTIIEATDEVKAKMMVKAQYCGARISNCSRA